MNNRKNRCSALLLLLVCALPSVPAVAADGHDIIVYRDASCGCCGRWIEHLERHNFNVTDRPVNDMGAVKRHYGVPPRLASCHTAVIDGYVIEGHVPADDIERLLRDRPDSDGLTVPGMPAGSPGMEMGDRRDAFAVYEFERNGEAAVFHSYPGR